MPNVALQLVLLFEQFPNEIHAKGANVLCRHSLKSIEVADLRDVAECLESFRWSPVDVWRKNMDQLVVNPFSPLSLLSGTGVSFDFFFCLKNNFWIN